MHLTKWIYILLTLVFACEQAQAQSSRADVVRRKAGLPRSAVLAYEENGLYAFDTREGLVLTAQVGDEVRVVGYSDGSSFSQASRNPVFRHLVRSYEQHITDEMRVFRPAGVKTYVEPLCGDTWHQYEPYNGMCPEVEGERCVTGCVATALGQVMNYWKWPKRGNGTYSYTDEKGTGGTYEVDFSQSVYDWDNILKDYYQPYNDRQAQAVAKLMWDCGVSVNMRYGTGSSSANSMRQPQALTSFFDYDPWVQQYCRNFFPQAEWDSIMFTELSEGRPMIVSAYSMELSHNFVCDGYDENGLFHISFGNPECDGNGYYFFNWLTPDQPQWHDVNNPETGLNLLQFILVGIQPNTGNTKQRYFFGFSHMDHLGDGRVAVYYLGNMGWNLHHGKVALALKPQDRPAVTSVDDTWLLYTYDRDFQLEAIDDTTYCDTIDLDGALKNFAGRMSLQKQYKVVPVYEENGQFHEARTMVGTPNFLVCRLDEDGQPRLSYPQNASARLRVTDVVCPDVVERWGKPKISFKIHNDGEEYSGRFFMAFHQDGEKWLSHVFCMEGINIGPGQTLERNLKLSNSLNPPEGDYRLWIMADVSLFTDSLVLLYDGGNQNIRIVPHGYTDIEREEWSVKSDANVYDLTGRRVETLHSSAYTLNALSPGIYFCRGRKILVK